MKQVREMSDYSAYIILDKKGREVAIVQARFFNGGSVQVDVWSEKPGEKYLSLTHQKRAGGYGYDKFTHALAGAWIDGHQIADHCGRAEPEHEKKKAALMRAYIRACAKGLTREETRAFEKKAEKIGARFENWGSVTLANGEKAAAWQSLQTESGLDRLRMLGYRVLCAI